MSAQDKARRRWGLQGSPLLDGGDTWTPCDTVERERMELAPDVYDARMELAMADAMTSYLVRNLPPEGSLTASDFAEWAIRLEVDGRRRLSANGGA
ncbi:MAG TPA: hypothetical protein VIH71_04680 [Solirubrobacteraceae bacterium]